MVAAAADDGQPDDGQEGDGEEGDGANDDVATGIGNFFSNLVA